MKNNSRENKIKAMMATAFNSNSFEEFESQMMKMAESTVGRPVSKDELDEMVGNTCNRVHKMLTEKK